jgi:Cu+-exporting ATPase
MLEMLKIGKAMDRVCGMEVKKRKAAGTSKYKGKTYYFCATGCKEKFDENPEEYVHKEEEHEEM